MLGSEPFFYKERESGRMKWNECEQALGNVENAYSAWSYKLSIDVIH